MNKLFLSIAATGILVFGPLASALPTGAFPQPEFGRENFLLTPDIEEMNVYFARLEAGEYSDSIKMVLIR